MVLKAQKNVEFNEKKFYKRIVFKRQIIINCEKIGRTKQKRKY